MNGYIQLHRSILDWEWYHDTNTKVVFLHLRLNARYEAGNWEGMRLEAGQVIAGRSKLARDLNMTEQEVRTALAHLTASNEITIEATKKQNLITIVKWAEYQPGAKASDQAVTQRATRQSTSQSTKRGTANSRVSAGFSEGAESENNQTINQTSNQKNNQSTKIKREAAPKNGGCNNQNTTCRNSTECAGYDEYNSDEQPNSNQKNNQTINQTSNQQNNQETTNENSSVYGCFDERLASEQPDNQPDEQPAKQPDNQPQRNNIYNNVTPYNNNLRYCYCPPRGTTTSCDGVTGDGDGENDESVVAERDLLGRVIATTETSHDKPLRTKKGAAVAERHTIPPRLEWVERYCQERGNGIDPQQFLDYYETRGWLIGKTRIKDWQAAVRTWERRNGDSAQPKPQTEKHDEIKPEEWY